jgi:hypothetical protein
MDSEFDDWVYWHFFTIKLDYHISHIELLLNDVCVTNLYEESQLIATLSNSRINFLLYLPKVEITASKGSISALNEWVVSETVY